MNQNPSLKHILFCNGPMGNKPNTALPGIGPVLGERLNNTGYPNAQHMFGQFLVYGQDPERFNGWFNNICGANLKQQWDCFNACQAWGYASRCYTVNSVRNMDKKIACDPEAARAHHRILVYRFRDRDGKLHEGYHDDGEHGAGRKLLQCMTQKNIIDITYVITRKFTKHIGPKRFNIMEDLVRDLATKL